MSSIVPGTGTFIVNIPQCDLFDVARRNLKILNGLSATNPQDMTLIYEGIEAIRRSFRVLAESRFSVDLDLKEQAIHKLKGFDQVFGTKRGPNLANLLKELQSGKNSPPTTPNSPLTSSDCCSRVSACFSDCFSAMLHWGQQQERPPEQEV